MVFPLNVQTFGRTIFLCLGLLAFTSNHLSAQKFSLGLKGGPLAVWTPYGDKDYQKTLELKPKVGFYFAGIISFPLKNNYSCVIEGGYSHKGRSVRFDDGNQMNKATYKFVDAALLLRKSFKFYLRKDVPADWFINIGPHISYWLSGKGTVGPVGSDGMSYKLKFIKSYESYLADHPGLHTQTIFMQDANRWLFGADIGVGMEAPITKTQRVMAELRFTWGHTYFGTKTSQYYNKIGWMDTNMEANEKVLSFTLAYMFDMDLRLNKTGRSTKDKETKRKPVKRRR